MNPFERAELEAEHDGYSNDYQRAFAVEQARRPIKDARPAMQEASNLDGMFRIACGDEVCCRITDALIGVSWHDHGPTFEDEPSLLDYVYGNKYFDGDERFAVIRPEVLGPPVPVVVEDDGCPF